MNWIIPGTRLTAAREEADQVQKQFEAMFFGGGITLSQVANITGLETHSVQNWVKRGFLSKPEHKKYTMRQFCRIVNINMLKSVLSLEEICSLLTYVNGELSDEGDDLVDDAQLYFMFVRLAAQARDYQNPRFWDEAIASVLKDYAQPIPGAKEKVEKVLRIMLTAWVSAQFHFQAKKMLEELV